MRLETLIRLRWLAIGGQAIAVLVVAFILRFPMQLALCLALIGVSALLNLVLRLRYPSSFRLRPDWAGLLLGFDVLQPGALLYMTGGLENPFALLLLVPVIISATTLEFRQTVVLGALVLVLFTVLALFYEPLPWRPEMPLALPDTYIGGVWVALVCALLFTAIYTLRVAAEARQLSEALTATELVLAREQHLTALDGLAAAAAHELGTPLATITLVAKDLARDFPTDAPHGDDVALLLSQVQRCRDILSKLTSLSAEADWHHSTLTLPNLIAEGVDPYRSFGVEIAVRVAGEGPEPIGRRNPAVIYGFGNLVENAVDFAKSRVEIDASWDADCIIVRITDDGPGFAPEILGRMGEPYFTTRGPDAGETPGAGGLGLGFFIAQTLLERTGARLKLSNRLAPATGAVVELRWPRGAALDANAAESGRLPA
jgi:two-component system sensor histidine kinase RegB